DALDKVDVIIDESIPEPGTFCPVTVALKDGSRLTHTARVAKGHPENPMSESEVLDKFRSNAKEAISVTQSEQLITMVENLEQIGDVRTLIDLLRPA
ncbi:MAG: hypothetical protein ACREO5_03040, partial [Candidatus Binatia bacterium]